MDQQSRPRSGWKFVADSELAASLIDAALQLDPDQPITQSELAEAADVTLKRLYLNDTISALVEAGFFERIDDEDAETRYVVVPDSDVLAAAERFDRALGERLSEE